MFSKTFKLTLVAIVVALVLDEIAVRLFVPVRNVGPSFSEYDPVYGKSLKKNFSCERITPEFRMSFTTNSFGFRGPERTTFPEKGILFLGDSFTEGYGVNNGEEFPALVRSTLIARYGPGNVAVVNAGLGNIGNGRWLKFLKREGQRYNPQLIVLQLTSNDFDDNLIEGLFSLSNDGTLVEHDPSPPGKFRLIQSFVEAIPGLSYSYLFGLIREAYYAATAASNASVDEDEQRRLDRVTFTITEEIIKLCKREQWPLVFMVVDFGPRRLHEMLDLLKKHHVPHIIPPAKSERPDLYFTIDGHWNTKGHQRAASMVLDVLDTLRFPKL